MIMVHKGETVLRIPATELSMWRWAAVNRNAGTKTPMSPDRNNLEMCAVLISFHFMTARGSNIKLATVIRSDATSLEEKTINPFFIRMNDVPQIRANVSRRIIESGEFLFSTVSDQREILCVVWSGKPSSCGANQRWLE